jgi:hypothetical protein
MNKLTPTFADLHKAQTNGAGSNPQIIHVMPAHEPTREGEQPPAVVTNLVTDQNSASGFAVAAAPAPAPLKVALIGTPPATLQRTRFTPSASRSSAGYAKPRCASSSTRCFSSG